MSSKVVEIAPRGFYLAHEVGQLAGVSGNTIGQWARRGYIRSSQRVGRPRVYSYQDIAEAMIVHELVHQGVHHREIWVTITALRTSTGSSWPLTNSPSLGITLRANPSKGPWLLVLQHGRYIRHAGSPNQGILEVDLSTVKKDLNRGGWAVRDLPDLSHIEVDPDRLSGRPTIKGRRVPVEKVGELARTPGGHESLRQDYDLTDAEISDAVRWWAKVREYEAA